MKAKIVSYLVEWEEGGSALYAVTKSESFDSRVTANRCFKQKRKKWIYVRMYHVASAKALLRKSAP